ncbi:ProQ/FINO family protein [Pandoraea sp.]|uniref:ProQ/FINO family protein n=1 Tax=Pandoraea sp. TaxID=1883445 RepID=UPI0012282650|nr:ProQ/FINO family protein [Pandoraea sp.]TAL54384.1 MAG: prop effector [Pandoraea sp.]TAM17434.1 MAG: prop effector [Pandoraea sp.]
MGFEQLAELKKQLAKEAREAKEKSRQAANPAGKPARPVHPARPSRPAQSKASGQAAAKSEPVDPVVRVIGKLQKRFPVAFPKNPAPKVPLKIGILTDLLAHAEELALGEAELREALGTWCRGSRYWACLTDGAARVDLTGAPAGQVSARDAAFARNQARGAPSARRQGRRAPASVPGDAATAQPSPAVSETNE